MSESCTLFCRFDVDNINSLKKRLEILDAQRIEFDIEQSNWSTVKCTVATGTVQFTRRVFVAQADPFTKLRATTVIRIQSRKESNPAGASKAESHVRSITCIVGVVAEPGFDQIDKLPELIGFLAMEYDALIFNGSDFMDLRGNIIFSV